MNARNTYIIVGFFVFLAIAIWATAEVRYGRPGPAERELERQAQAMISDHPDNEESFVLAGQDRQEEFIIGSGRIDEYQHLANAAKIALALAVIVFLAYFFTTGPPRRL